MKQRTVAMMTGFERYTKKTKRALFLEEMEQVIPWRQLCALIDPHYPKAGNGRAPIGVERMLRIYFLQQWLTCRTQGWKRFNGAAAVRGHRSRAGTSAGRNHGVQVPPFVGGTRSGRGDAGDGEPAFARKGEYTSAPVASWTRPSSMPPARLRTGRRSVTGKCTRRGKEKMFKQWPKS